MTGSLRIVYMGFCLTIAFAVWLLVYGLALQLLYGDGIRTGRSSSSKYDHLPFELKPCLPLARRRNQDGRQGLWHDALPWLTPWDEDCRPPPADSTRFVAPRFPMGDAMG